MNKEEGLRYNQGKLRYDLLHPVAQEGIVSVLTKGAEKYAPRNWEKGLSWTSVVASLKRHLAAFERGEDYDSETGELHINHIQCNAHFLSAYYKIAPQFDDRLHLVTPKKRIGLDIDEVICDWVSHWCKYHNLPIPDCWLFDRKISEKFFKLKEDKEFWLSIPAKINPSELPFEPHAYITARSIPTEWTEEWLDKHGFPAAKVYSVGYNESKVDKVKESGVDYFIDDSYSNYEELNRNGICTFLMHANHNRRYDVGYRRIKDFNDFKERFL